MKDLGNGKTATDGMSVHLTACPYPDRDVRHHYLDHL